MQYDADVYQRCYYRGFMDACAAIREAIKLRIETYENSKVWDGLKDAYELIGEDFMK